MIVLDTPAPTLPRWEVDGTVIQRLRQAQGKSYDDVIRNIGISHDDILAIEDGLLQPPAEVIDRLARRLEVSTIDILKHVEESGPEPDLDDDVVIPERAGGWAEVADAEQRLRLYAARKAAEILRETGSSGVFSNGGMRAIDPERVILLAQWIVYGS